jgi:hypothetical protein
LIRNGRVTTVVLFMEVFNKSVVVRFSLLVFSVFLLTAEFAPPSEAQYLDPGSGSYLLQIAIAAVLGGVFFFTSLFSRFKERLERVFRKTPRE